jgi:ribosomal-protein-alanine N-acetyltransferase
MADFKCTSMLPQLQRGESISLTEDYTARLIEHADIPDIVTMLRDPRVQEFLFFCPSPDEVYQGYFTPLADCAAAFRAQAADASEESRSDEVIGPAPENLVLIVREKESGAFAGNIGIMTPMSMFCPGNVEVGYQFVASTWGKGLATAGTRLLLHLAFHEMGAHKASADLYGKNLGSARVLEKAGFVKEGCLNNYYKIKSVTEDGVEIESYDDKCLHGITIVQYETLPISFKFTTVENTHK